jgi:glycosyltransferase involved in cell wall biosynthesis
MSSTQRKHSRIRVGIQGTGYVQKRMLSNVGQNGISLVRVYDAVAVALKIERMAVKFIPATAPLNCLHSGLSIPRVDLFHFVNSLSTSFTPWIVSFEHYVPRWDITSRFGLRLLARPECRHLHAMSEFARRAQHKALDRVPEWAEQIDRKMSVLHPPQRLTVPDYAAKPLPEDGFVFTFIGREFFRKGGAEVLRAARRLLSEGHTFTLHVVSTLEIGDYVTKSTETDRQNTLAMMNALAPSVIHHNEMPNDEVLRLLAGSHVALLPTYDDTYGFSVLEAQGAGTPVITTNVCAMDEINNDATGWVIRLERNEAGEASHLHDAGRSAVSERLERGVYEAMRNALTDREGVRVKGQRVLGRIAAEHDPATYASRIHDLYEEALERKNGEI